MSSRPAVFLDRDGTLIDDPGFLRDPGDVRLLPGAAAALRRLNEAGLLAVVVTNQSGIGRGLITEAELESVTARLRDLLAAEGARLDGHYHCPHAPDRERPCDCRKPGPALFRRAAEDLGIDLKRSWWVGDRPSDLEPARVFGGRAIGVRTGEGRHAPEDGPDPAADDIEGAVGYILAHESR